MLELDQFNSQWDRKMAEYEMRATELLEAMRLRHALDVKEARARVLDHGLGFRPKFSKERLELRRMETSAARLAQYAEAHQVKLRADALEAQALQRLDADRQQAASNAELNLLQRQESELGALRQRIQNGAEEQRKARQSDLERMLQRYQNVTSELEAQQGAEWHKQGKSTGLDPQLVKQISESTRSVPRPKSPGASQRSSKPIKTGWT